MAEITSFQKTVCEKGPGSGQRLQLSAYRV